MWKLATAGEAQTSFVRAHLASIKEIPAARIAGWIGDLASDDFSVREKATRELDRAGEQAGDSLRAALKLELPLEAKRRAEQLLAGLSDGNLSPGRARELRAVEALEYARAERALEAIVSAPIDPRVRREAREALERLRSPVR